MGDALLQAVFWAHLKKDTSTHNRTGVVMPFRTSWNYENFLTALRNRWVFGRPTAQLRVLHGGRLPWGAR